MYVVLKTFAGGMDFHVRYMLEVHLVFSFFSGVPHLRGSTPLKQAQELIQNESATRWKIPWPGYTMKNIAKLEWHSVDIGLRRKQNHKTL